MFSTIGHILRLSRVGLTLSRYDALLPKEYRERMPLRYRLIGDLMRLVARRRKPRTVGARLAAALERLGPAYVKVGQFLATRPDMIGVTAAQELGRLKDRLPPFSRNTALDTINAELGATEGLFGTVSDPLAAASIAQVHQALLPNGVVKAVKVLRPRIERRLARDMAALRFLAQTIEFFSPRSRRLEPVQFIDTVSSALERELDLRLEAGAAAEFREVAEADGYLTVPNIDWSRSSKRVMTLDWIEGVPFTDHKALVRAGADMQALAIAVTRGFLAAALDHGFFHADMHEGNLIYGRDGKVWVVDFGIMGRIGHKERRYLAEILYGFLQRDYKRVAKVHAEAGYVNERFTVEEFAQALRAIGEPIFGKTADGISMSRLLLQLFDVTHLFGMHLRPELVLLQKTMVQTEGVARALDPKHDMWNAARPIVERWVKRELGPEGVARRGLSEAGDAFQSLRRLPQTLAAIEEAARRANAAPPPEERARFQWMSAWVGFAVGAVAFLMIAASGIRARTPTMGTIAPAPADEKAWKIPSEAAPAAAAPRAPAPSTAAPVPEEDGVVPEAGASDSAPPAPTPFPTPP
ncbi:MAG: 2-polyprenylphenol 6-hydroxylase [Hydrogenophilaceae bacterium]|jgi:ubiquinone biosynthesis protein|nr:2-polyprenylphenol 6-hydroxylase [Hydrogenophilaceae bacterium]